MQRRYVAYGLQLSTSFALPGMRPDASPALPCVELTLGSRQQLEAAWSGASDAAVWEGRLGDGCRLRIERGARGDVLFRYGARAVFRLDAAQESLDCAPAEGDLDWLRVLMSKVLCHVSLMRGYEGLHAAAVDSGDGVLAFVGASGVGKSTLAIELMRRGWPLFADDMLTLTDGPSCVEAHPAGPHMSVSDELSQAEGLGTVLANLHGERWIAAEASCRGPNRVRALCLLRRGEGLRLGIRTLPANPLLLAPYMLGFEGDAERQCARFHLYADLMGATSLLQLTSGPADSPAELADLLEQRLVNRPALAGVSA